jgi:hypothetical protein
MEPEGAYKVAALNDAESIRSVFRAIAASLFDREGGEPELHRTCASASRWWPEMLS